MLQRIGVRIMLLRFLLNNWTSYKEDTELSLLATAEKQHAETLSSVKKFRLKLLPLTAIYGANASGKSNLVEALAFVKAYVLQGVGINDAIPVKRFKLDDLGTQKPLTIELDLLINELIYEFAFSVTPDRVVSESLHRVNSTSRKMLYRRVGQEFVLGEGLKERELLNFSTKTTRANTLFLTNTVLQAIPTFKEVFDWFEKQLVIVTPYTMFGPVNRIIDKSDPLSKSVSQLLVEFGTGVERLEGQEIDLSSVPLSTENLKALQTQLKDGEKSVIRHPWLTSAIVLYKQGDEIKAKKVIAKHRKADGTEVAFSLDEESDGTNRLVDLAPSLLMLCQPKLPTVVVIDELDRSLHTLVTQECLKRFLDHCGQDNRNQLIFTTQDVQLMDQKLLRRDEIWVSEKNSNGESTLVAFSEFKDIRSDNNLINNYLLGRLGGLPNISG